jgi:release factor glutamine methyltransferase
MSEAITVSRLLAEVPAGTADAPPSRRESILLLARVLGWSEAQVLAREERPIEAGLAERWRALIARRRLGEPVAYLLGEREFYGRSFHVDARVLIPRPETEHLVEATLALPLGPAPRILDIGTGSGCIAVTLALELPRARVTGTDRSIAALAVARGNGERLAPGRVSWTAGDLAACLRPAAFDVVVANPPYIGHDERAVLSPEVVDFEPAGALFSPGESDSMLRRLIGLASDLRSGSFVVLETGHQQAERLAEDVAPPLLVREVRRDYAGIPRILVLGKR